MKSHTTRKSRKSKVSLDNYISSNKQVFAYIKTTNSKSSADFDMWDMTNLSSLPKNFEENLGVLMGIVKWKQWTWDGSLKDVEGELIDFDGNQITSITAH